MCIKSGRDFGNLQRVYEVAKLSGIQMYPNCKDPIFVNRMPNKKFDVKNNWIPGLGQLGHKGLFWEHYKNMTNKYGTEDFSYMPRSFLLPGDYEELRDAWDTSSAWIIKPTQVQIKSGDF